MLKAPARVSLDESQLDSLLCDALTVLLLCSVPFSCHFYPFSLVSTMTFCCFLSYSLGFYLNLQHLSPVSPICSPLHHVAEGTCQVPSLPPGRAPLVASFQHLVGVFQSCRPIPSQFKRSLPCSDSQHVCYACFAAFAHSLLARD